MQEDSFLSVFQSFIFGTWEIKSKSEKKEKKYSRISVSC